MKQKSPQFLTKTSFLIVGYKVALKLLFSDISVVFSTKQPIKKETVKKQKAVCVNFWTKYARKTYSFFDYSILRGFIRMMMKVCKCPVRYLYELTSFVERTDSVNSNSRTEDFSHF